MQVYDWQGHHQLNIELLKQKKAEVGAEGGRSAAHSSNNNSLPYVLMNINTEMNSNIKMPLTQSSSWSSSSVGVQE